MKGNKKDECGKIFNVVGEIVGKNKISSVDKFVEIYKRGREIAGKKKATATIALLLFSEIFKEFEETEAQNIQKGKGMSILDSLAEKKNRKWNKIRRRLKKDYGKEVLKFDDFLLYWKRKKIQFSLENLVKSLLR